MKGYKKFVKSTLAVLLSVAMLLLNGCGTNESKGDGGDTKKTQAYETGAKAEAMESGSGDTDEKPLESTTDADDREEDTSSGSTEDNADNDSTTNKEIQKDTDSNQKDTTLGQKETGSNQKDTTLVGQKETGSNQKDTTLGQKETGSNQKDTTIGQKETDSNQKDTTSNRKETEPSKETTSQKPTVPQKETTTQKPSSPQNNQQVQDVPDTPDNICCPYVTDELVNKFKNAYLSGNINGLNTCERAFFTNLKKALDAASKYTKAVDKEKAVHDWIVLNTKYDEKGFSSGNIPSYSFAADGVFRYGTAVCDGYQKAFMLCMRILGIECETVTGTGNGQAHAWNIVKLDGEWYQVDVTWDDPVPDIPGKVSYGYFNVTDEQMRKTHVYSAGRSCTATKYSYMNYYSDVAFVRNSEDFVSAIKAAVEGKAPKCHVYVLIDYYQSSYYDWSLVYEATGRAVLADCPSQNYIVEDTLSPDGKKYVDVTYTLTYDSFKVYDIAVQEDADRAAAEALSAGAQGMYVYGKGIDADTLFNYVRSSLKRTFSYNKYEKGYYITW